MTTLDRLLRSGLVVSAFVAQGAAAQAGTFGTRCQGNFNGSWQQNLSYVYARCEGFNNELDDYDTKKFYFNLSGAVTGFSGSDGSLSAGGVDAVDLFYMSTHGGVDDVRFFYALKEQNQFACSRFSNWTSLCVPGADWRYGDNSRTVKIFSQYTCATLAIDDFAWDRWKQPFRGGLYLATGSHDKLYDGSTTDETGEDYADDLQDGKSVKWAWFDGNGDWNADQDVAIYASSSGSLSECQVRRDYMTWQNVIQFPRLRDGNMNRICASWISNN
jgi:hypothetical protein